MYWIDHLNRCIKKLFRSLKRIRMSRSKCIRSLGLINITGLQKIKAILLVKNYPKLRSDATSK